MTITDTLTETVAITIMCADYRANYDPSDIDPWEHIGLSQQNDYRRYAQAAIAAIRKYDEAEGMVTFQSRVLPWLDKCFGPEIAGDRLERGDRFLEEALELLQATGYPRDRVSALEKYVYERPIGEPSQEVGGVMVTLAAHCLAHDIDMHKAGETELARVWTKVEKIRAKQAAKPTGSALPIALTAQGGEGE